MDQCYIVSHVSHDRLLQLLQVLSATCFFLHQMKISQRWGTSRKPWCKFVWRVLMVGWNTKKINTKLLFKPFWIGSKPKLILKSFWMAMELERTMKTLCYWIIQHFTITTNYRWSYFGKECHWVTYMLCNNNKNYYVSVIVLFFYKFLITFLAVLFCNQSLLNTWRWNYMYFEFIGCILQISDNTFFCHQISYI